MNRKHRTQRIKDIAFRAFCIFMFLLCLVWLINHPEASALDKPLNVTDVPLPTYIGKHYVTGYVPTDASQCGKSPDSPYIGIGASGERIIPGEHVAMKSIPFGTRIFIDGLGEYTVQDRGVGKGKVDVACETDAECYEITGRYTVYIIG